MGPFPWSVALAEEAEPAEIVEEPETPGEIPDGTAPQVKIVLTDGAGEETVWEDRREEVKDTLFLREPGTLRVEAEDDETPQEELQIELLRVEKEDGKYPLLDDEFLENAEGWEALEGDLSLENGTAQIIAARAVDKAGNRAYSNTEEIVVDGEKPKVDIYPIDVDIPMIDGKIARRGDLELVIAAEDPLPGGIEALFYEVTADGRQVMDGILYQRGEDEEAKEKLEKTLLIPAAQCEGKVVIRVAADDRAGNRTEKSCEAVIDVTAPVVRLEYDNNEALGDGLFANSRTGTVTIEERHFDPALAEVLINGNAVPLTWGRVGENLYQGTFSLPEDGVYRVEIGCEDKLGNRSGEILPALGTKWPYTFTIDTHAPHILILYDNASIVKNGIFGAPIDVDINIFDANLAENTVEVTSTGGEMEKNGLFEAIRWEKTENGLHGRLQIDQDGLWQFRVSAADRAGNLSSAVSEPVLLDLTPPAIRMEGLEDGSSYRSTAGPVITFSDANPDPSSYRVTLQGTKGVRELPGVWEENVFRCTGFPTEAEWDDRYVLTAEMQDLTGRTAREELAFTLNRSGSSFRWEEAAEKLRGAFTREVPDLVLTETNLDLLTEQALILFRDGVSRPLEEGSDYLVTREDLPGSHRYTYKIFGKIFAGEGSYQLRIRTSDAAGNRVAGEAKIMSTTLDIYVDDISPTVEIHGFNDFEDTGGFEVFAYDRGGLESIIVTPEGGGEAVFSLRGEDLRRALKEDGAVRIQAPEGDWSTLLITASDRAGNRTENRVVRTGTQVEIEAVKEEKKEDPAPAAAPKTEAAAEEKIKLAKTVGADLYGVKEEQETSPAARIALVLLAALVLSAALMATRVINHHKGR
ncbi:MAG: hypothetical protein IIY84_03435 [Eubacterium sp.]|nr:hypothetical protein [Eubacterium sp.]